MLSSTNTSGSVKRPCPFGSDESFVRRPEFVPSLNRAIVEQREKDTAGVGTCEIGEAGSTSSVGSFLDDPTFSSWNFTFYPRNVFSSQIAERAQSSDRDHYTEYQNDNRNWNTLQSRDNNSCNVANANDDAFVGQSADLLDQSHWNVQTAAEGLYPPQYSSLTSDHRPEEPHFFSNEWQGPGIDTWATQSWDPVYVEANAEYSHVAAGQGSACLEPVESVLLTPDTQVGEVNLGNTAPTIIHSPAKPESPAGSTFNESTTIDNDNICFGTICDVLVRSTVDSRAFEKSNNFSITSDKQEVRKFVIVRRDHHYAIQCEQDVDIGVINNKMTKGLRHLDEIGSVAYEGVAEAHEFDEIIKKWKKEGKAADWAMEINISGPQTAKEKVGKLLSEDRLYLQQPRWLARGLSVHNPHRVEFPNLTIQSKSVQLPTPSSMTEYTFSPSLPNLSDVFEDLDQNEDVELTDVDCRITTPLLRHQQQGLCFLLRREAALPLSSFSLWEDAGTGVRNARYQHRITGKRTSEPCVELCGGVVADEMGLGKSLMMLSAIVAKMSQSRSFCESGGAAIKLEKRRSRASLVVVTSALLLNGWMAEIERHIRPNTLRVQKYHGSRKETDLVKLTDYDIVLTTYATITAEFTGNSRLHNVNWFRIVLDEAHTIRNDKTKQFRAVASLSAKIRWCLTGTPIQNKVEDLGALVRFLQVPLLDTPLAFRTHFTQHIETGLHDGFKNLRTLLKCICIRRTKELLRLPEPRNVECILELSPVERSRYEHIGELYRGAIDDAICGRKPSEAYRSIFQALAKFRMLCNHGTLLQSDATSAADEIDESIALLQEGPLVCAYCGTELMSDGAEEDLVAGQLPACSHVVCGGCVRQYEEDLQRLRAGAELACPLCKVPLIKEDVLPKMQAVEEGSRISLCEDGVSTKLSMLVDDIKEYRFLDKCIIFSYWKKTLHIISMLLSKEKIRSVQVDGSLSLPARREVLSAFQQDEHTPVLLMTLGTGAVGLNLTVATRIHIVEPQWNPSVESQAIGRAVRIGQQKQVTIIRYVMLDTVEQYIQSRQSRKSQIAELGLGACRDDEDPKDVKLKKLMAEWIYRICASSYEFEWKRHCDSLLPAMLKRPSHVADEVLTGSYRCRESASCSVYIIQHFSPASMPSWSWKIAGSIEPVYL